MKLLEVAGLSKTYVRGKYTVPAVRNVSLFVEPCERLGIIGESGSGKSTLSRMIALLEPPDSGSICLMGEEIASRRGAARREIYRRVQLVFQNPGSSFDPRQKIGAALAETARNFGAARPAAAKRAGELLERVGLGGEYMLRYPHELSGGECQRAALARALLPRPKLLICDEVTSALDAAVGEQILELLDELSRENDMALLMISHDLSVVRRMCGRSAVMYRGEIVETGETGRLLTAPGAPYTKLLAESAGWMNR